MLLKGDNACSRRIHEKTAWRNIYNTARATRSCGRYYEYFAKHVSNFSSTR